MKKIIALFVALIIIGFIALTPVFSGYAFKKQYLNLIASLNEQSPTAKIIVEKYESGWLEAHAVLHIQDTNPQAHQELISITQTIHHGPLIFNQKRPQHRIFALATIQSNIHLNKDNEQLLPFFKTGLMNLYTEVDFAGNYINYIDTPAINISNVVKMQWQGLHGKITVTQNHHSINAVRSDLDFTPLFAEILPGTNISIFPMKFTSSYVHEPNNLWEGNDLINLTNIKVNKANQLFLEMNDFKFSEQISIDAGLYQSLHQLNIKQLTIPGFIIPSFSTVTFNLGVKNINSNELAKLVQALKANANAYTMVPDKYALMNKVLSNITQLITPNTEINLKFAANTNDGPAELNIQISWATPLPTNTDQLIKKAQVKGNLRLSTGLVQRSIAYSKAQQIGVIAELPPQPIISSTPNNTTIFNDKVAALVKANKINAALAIQVMELRDKKLSGADFSKNIQALKLPVDIEKDLSQTYNMAPVAPIAVPQQPIYKSVIEQWIDAGYLKLNKDTYIFDMDVRNGTTTINGKVV